MGQSTASTADLDRLQRKIGYRFEQLALLKQALTHKSYSKTNNERLEFMGDAVLGYLVGNMLYQHYPDVQEDALSLMRAQLVRGKTLAQVASRIDLSEYLLLGVGELRSGGRQRASILADALEAVIGAVHEDGGIEQAQRLVRLLFADGSRVVFRLSGTGVAGATVRMYLEKYEAPGGDLLQHAFDVVKPIAESALKVSKLEEFTGRTEPTVIT